MVGLTSTKLDCRGLTKVEALGRSLADFLRHAWRSWVGTEETSLGDVDGESIKGRLLASPSSRTSSSLDFVGD